MRRTKKEKYLSRKKKTNTISRRANVVRSDRPRLVLYRSNKHIYAQLVDDLSHKVITGVFDKDAKGTKLQKAEIVGERIAKVATSKKITQVVFDRNGFLYHGRVKALADSARKHGLKF